MWTPWTCTPTATRSTGELEREREKEKGGQKRRGACVPLFSLEEGVVQPTPHHHSPSFLSCPRISPQFRPVQPQVQPLWPVPPARGVHQAGQPHPGALPGRTHKGSLCRPGSLQVPTRRVPGVRVRAQAGGVGDPGGLGGPARPVLGQRGLADPGERRGRGKRGKRGRGGHGRARARPLSPAASHFFFSISPLSSRSPASTTCTRPRASSTPLPP